MTHNVPKKLKMHNRPLIKLLIERDFFRTEDEAQRWIMAGKVLVNGQRIDKIGTQVRGDAHLRILGYHRYASRGGYKLAAALDYFNVNVNGLVALDCGASTGGFTDCLLQRGASLVYAVDVGFGQLLGRLQADQRVHNLERTNLSDLISFSLNPNPTLITLDLSYLSLAKALPIASQLVSDGEVLALFKPLFEVESSTARRTGKIDDATLLTTALFQVLNVGIEAGLVPLGVVKLALKPRHGVHEFFLHFTTKQTATTWNFNQLILEKIVESEGVGVVEED